VDLEKQKLWKQRIAEYEASGWSGTRWCKEQGIAEHQFWYWKKKFQKATAAKKEAASTWVAVAHEDTTPSSFTIRVGSVEVEGKAGYDEKLLQNVVRTLVLSVC
jgi:hypothetical protein